VESFYVWGNEHQVLNLNGVYGVRVKKEGKKRDGSAPGNQKNSSGPKEKEIPGGILRRR
jgi:hypothetical protein